MKTAERVAPLVVAVAMVAVATFGLKRGLFVAAGADAYGYVSQADLWASGHLVIQQPFAEKMTWPNASASLAPLGYRPHTTNPADKDIVPVNPPGLPMLMAIFKLAGGDQAVFFVVPLLAALAVWATYAMGRSLAGPLVGASAAVMLAASPTFLFEVVSPTSDIPCTAWWALGWALLMIERRSASLAAGLSVGCAILTRPQLVLAGAAPGALLVWRAIRAKVVRAEGDGPSGALFRLVLFAAGSVPACLAVAAINRHLYGSPIATGFGPLQALYSWSFFGTNIARYPLWIVQTETVFVALALLAPFVLKPNRSTGVRMRDPKALSITWLSFIGLTFLPYVFYVPWEEWWYVRFLMPAYPPMLVLTAAVLWTLAAPVEQYFAGARDVVAATAVAAVVWHGVSFSVERGAQRQWIAEQRYKTVGRYIAANLPERSVFISVQHSGAARFYSGRITVRYDFIEPRDLTRVVRQLRELGYTPYLLLDEAEEAPFRERFAARSAVGRLDWPPVARLDEDRVRIYEAPKE